MPSCPFSPCPGYRTAAGPSIPQARRRGCNGARRYAVPDSDLLKAA